MAADCHYLSMTSVTAALTFAASRIRWVSTDHPPASNVVDADYQPIPGLYAIGNVCGGMYGVDYPLLLNGNSYGRAFSYSLALGRILSGKPDEE